MPALTTAHRNLAELVRFTGQLTSCAVWFVRALVLPRTKTAASIVALDSQLATSIDQVQQGKEPGSRSTPAFRLLWVVLSRFLDGWEGRAAASELY